MTDSTLAKPACCLVSPRSANLATYAGNDTPVVRAHSGCRGSDTRRQSLASNDTHTPLSGPAHIQHT